MSEKQSTVRDLVARCGGIRAVARACDCSRGLVDNWLEADGVYSLTHALALVEATYAGVGSAAKFDLLGKLVRPKEGAPGGGPEGPLDLDRALPVRAPEA